MIVGLGLGDQGVCDGVGVGLRVGEADTDGVDDAVSVGDPATIVAAAVELVCVAGAVVVAAVVGVDAELVFVVGSAAAAWVSRCASTATSAVEAGGVDDVVAGAAADDAGVLTAAACLPAAGVAAAGLRAADSAVTVG